MAPLELKIFIRSYQPSYGLVSPDTLENHLVKVIVLGIQWNCVCLFVQVGREDSGKPLWYFREVLSLPVERKQPLPFFFHAGETGESLKHPSMKFKLRAQQLLLSLTVVHLHRWEPTNTVPCICTVVRPFYY